MDNNPELTIIEKTLCFTFYDIVGKFAIVFQMFLERIMICGIHELKNRIWLGSDEPQEALQYKRHPLSFQVGHIIT